MNGFFNPDGGFMGFLGKVFDVMMLSMLWLLFSVPIVTMGASTTALYYSTVKSIRRERGYFFKEFWHSFKSNFIVATIMWVILLILALLFSINLKFALKMEGNLGIALFSVYCVLVFFIASTSVYLFPVLSRFKMKIKDIVKTSMFMGIKHLPSSFLFILIILATVFALWLIPALAFILPASSALLYSLFMEKILKKYTPETNEEGKDTWYLD